MFDSEGAAVDVIVPVFGAPEALARCLSSVRTHTDLSRHRLTLVADGPQPAAVEQQLQELRGVPGIRVVALPTRGGFVAATNRGLAQAEGRDVILLNSDTQVTRGWIDKLARAARSVPEVASVTPFSNSATICSLPRWLEANALPAGYSLEAFADLVERVSLPEYPRLPTGVGVCMYVRGAALERVGALDERAFGLGYGEEVDWCLRARRAGFVHLLDDATFIFHDGQSSFGASRDRRVRAAHRVLARRHPGYLREIADFLRRDPLEPARQRVRAAMTSALVATRKDRFPSRTAPEAPRSVLHIVHGWPPWSRAGTETYAAGLVRRQMEGTDGSQRRVVTVLARLADPRRRLGEALEYDFYGARVRLLVNNFTQRDPLSRNALREQRFERELQRLLREAAPDLVHVHHLAGLCATLPRLAARRGIPIVYQLQDWWAPCARANLLDRDGRLCSGPAARKCGRCLPLTAVAGAALWNPLLYAWRARLLRRALRSANALIAGSQAIVDSHRRLGWLSPQDVVQVLPYGVEPVAATASGASGVSRTGRLAAPVRFGFVGAAMPHKGLDVATAAFAGIDPGRARLIVWGDASAAPDYARRALQDGGAAVDARGGFAERDIETVFASFDVLIVPSRGLESFGLVAREAMLRGVPVLASRRGALPEMFLPGREYGATFDPDQPAELRAWIERLSGDPAEIERWRVALPPILTMDEHAEQIEAVYSKLLRRPTSLVD